MEIWLQKTHKNIFGIEYSSWSRTSKKLHHYEAMSLVERAERLKKLFLRSSDRSRVEVEPNRVEVEPNRVEVEPKANRIESKSSRSRVEVEPNREAFL